MRPSLHVGGRARRGLTRRVFFVLAGIGVFPLSAVAQDVELIGRIHGTRPPDAYYEQLRRDPDSFRFGVEGRARMEALRDGLRRSGAGTGGGAGARAPGVDAGGVIVPSPPARQIGPRDEPVVGIVSLPLVLGLFSSAPGAPPYSRDQVQREFFEGPNSNGLTLPEFYDEMSGGLVQLQGVTFPWVTTPYTQAQVTMGGSGLFPSSSGGVGAFIEAILEVLDASGVDWAQFDRSGDGYVDVLTVLHPTSGAECNRASDRVWSHRWTLADMTLQRLENGFETSTPNPNGPGNIRINDYTIQPLLACDGTKISEIGTFAHEMGHAFGLPDLYRTNGTFWPGAGNWDLMGTGGWGCQGGTPHHPCHMGAWSKAMLGWLDVDEVAPGQDQLVTLEPVIAGRRVLKLPAQDGTNEYVLIENRQRIGSDMTLAEPGLLIWHIDNDVLAQTWSDDNSVNNSASRPGVWLRQADGRQDLFSTLDRRGDRGDPFPGCIKPSPQDDLNDAIPCTTNHEFHAGSVPAALSHQGGGLGVTLTGIELIGGEPHDVRFQLSTRVSTVRVEAEREGQPVSVPGFQIDDVTYDSTPITFASAPFQTHQIIAAPGIPIAPGVRYSFADWVDGAPRSRPHTGGFSDVTLVARYGAETVRLRVETNDPAGGIPPGTFSANPGGVAPEDHDFWFPRGTHVSVLAIARTGFSFREWVGVAPSGSNPANLILTAPTAIRANFDLRYALAAPTPTVEIEAATLQEIALEVSEANEPVSWSVTSGALPPGMELGVSTGVIGGAATRTGTFEAEVLARDAIGLEARAAIEIEVAPPNVGVTELVSSFVGSEDLLTELQKTFFDFSGNEDGSYDVGDFRAYLLENPDLPESAAAARPGRIDVRVGELVPGGKLDATVEVEP
jgi:M6 family metalloprotease-like protein